MPLGKVPEHVEKRKAKRGQFRTAKKTYHDKTTAHKSVQHPHSRLKTQKEYKAITDSAAYKKADYHTKNKMLKKHPTTMKKDGRAGFKHGKWVRATGIPHADIAKYVDKKTGKEDDKKGSRARISDTTMEFKKPGRGQRGQGLLGGLPKGKGKKLRPSLGGRALSKAAKSKGGRIGLKHGSDGAQQHYLQHGYGPHKVKVKVVKASDKAIKGNKLTKKA